VYEVQKIMGSKSRRHFKTMVMSSNFFAKRYIDVSS